MKKTVLLLSLNFLIIISSQAQDILKAARQFISTLDEEQKTKTLFPFDGEERYNYHFVPFVRKGITLHEMNDEQKKAAFTLLQTCLSKQTFQKTNEIRNLELVLKALEKRKPEDQFRDTGNYHFSIFGIPAPNTIWGWRFEGHHMSFNFSVDKNKLVAATPGFLGSNPGFVLDDPQKNKEVLKDETETGYALLETLTTDQKKRAVIDSVAPAEILSSDKRKLLLENPAGIPYSALSPIQQQAFLKIVQLYVHRYTKLFAEDMFREIQHAGLDHLWFAWTGSTEKGIGHPHYYRIQGPTLLIEYDNTQNNANHVHSVIRDLKHDFGGDELPEHYKQAHNQ